MTLPFPILDDFFAWDIVFLGDFEVRPGMSFIAAKGSVELPDFSWNLVRFNFVCSTLPTVGEPSSFLGLPRFLLAMRKGY